MPIHPNTMSQNLQTAVNHQKKEAKGNVSPKRRKAEKEKRSDQLSFRQFWEMDLDLVCGLKPQQWTNASVFDSKALVHVYLGYVNLELFRVSMPFCAPLLFWPFGLNEQTSFAIETFLWLAQTDEHSLSYYVHVYHHWGNEVSLDSAKFHNF